MNCCGWFSPEDDDAKGKTLPPELPSERATKQTPAAGTVAASASKDPATRQAGAGTPDDDSKPAKPSSRHPTTTPDAALEKNSPLVPQLSLEDVRDATAGFEQERMLGEGSMGRVFVGLLPDGTSVAIKVLKGANPGRDMEVFQRRVAVASRLQHPNVVPLKGYCIEGNVRILAYQLAPRGSLSDVLHAGQKGTTRHSKPPPLLRWQHRMALAMGAARGLHYLHEQALVLPLPTAHSVTSRNVMLYDRSTAKIGDFLFSDHSEEVEESFDPEQELARDSIPERERQEKAGVFGFGVILLELLTGRRAVDPSSRQSLVAWAFPRLSAAKVGSIVDPRLKGHFPAEGPHRLGIVAALCMDDIQFRPNMRIVIEALQPLLLMPVPHGNPSPRQRSYSGSLNSSLKTSPKHPASGI